MIDVGILITGGVGIITSVVSSGTAWFFARKKYNSEVDSNLINNMKDSLEFYKKLSDDNRSRLEEVLKRNDELEKRDEKLEEEVRQLRKQVFEIMAKICLNLECAVRVRSPKLFENDKQ